MEKSITNNSLPSAGTSAIHDIHDVNLQLNIETDQYTLQIDNSNCFYKVNFKGSKGWNFSIADCLNNTYFLSQCEYTSEQLESFDVVSLAIIYGDYLHNTAREKSFKKYCEKHSITVCNLDTPQKFSKNDSSEAIADIVADPNTLTPEEVFIMNERHEILIAEIAKLSKKQQEVLHLILNGLTDVEIAFKLGIDPTSVRDRKKSAFKKLQQSGRLRDLL